jgi:hypothetical protein
VDVQFLVEQDRPGTEGVVSAAASEIQFYLIDKGEPKPWAYAKYHCNSSANLNSLVHWSFREPPAE